MKPDFFADEDVAELSPWARLLFIGLWNMADREGRLEDRPRRIKIAVFPFDDQDVDALLTELAGHQFIIRYGAEDKRFIQVRTFVKNQRPHPKEPPSVIPSPCKRAAGTDPAVERNGSSLSRRVDKGNGMEWSNAREEERDLGAEFKTWFAAYPRQAGEMPARHAWVAVTDLPPLADLLAALKAQGANQTDPTFWPNPEKYLHERRWLDKPLPPRAREKNPGRGGAGGAWENR